VSVLDASAVLAFLLGEPGADTVESALVDGAVCGAANWSEVAQKVRSSGQDWRMSKGLLESYRITVEPVTIADAEWAARAWSESPSHSLADRLCRALGARTGDPVLTADRSWVGLDGVTLIR
jgi:ribonuclease VapC